MFDECEFGDFKTKHPITGRPFRKNLRLKTVDTADGSHYIQMNWKEFILWRDKMTYPNTAAPSTSPTDKSGDGSEGEL